MALTSRKNMAVKALQAVMATGKKNNDNILLEWEMACNTNVNRGHIYNQSEIHELYGRDEWGARRAEQGATKTCHLRNHNGKPFQYIVIKRHQTHGMIAHATGKQTGNQLIDEINCWLELQETAEADLLCPILKYFTSKSDKVSATSKKMQHNVVIIAQKAIYVGDASSACREAERMNKEKGLRGIPAERRYNELQRLSNARGWWDAMRNPGNSGVIYDYNLNCYKAVFIDYAL